MSAEQIAALGGLLAAVLAAVGVLMKIWKDIRIVKHATNSTLGASLLATMMLSQERAERTKDPVHVAYAAAAERNFNLHQQQQTAVSLEMQ